MSRKFLALFIALTMTLSLAVNGVTAYADDLIGGADVSGVVLSEGGEVSANSGGTLADGSDNLAGISGDVSNSPGIRPANDPVEPTTEINILSFNDYHGQVESSSSRAGSARFAAVMNKLKADYPNSFVLANGDNYQGSALSNYYRGKPVSDMFKAMGVEYSSIGNHEFDWGDSFIPQFAEDGDITLLCSNMFFKGTNDRPDFCEPYAIKEIAGKKIGIVGYIITSTPTLVKAEYVKDYEFRSPGQWMRDIITDLRTNQGCDAVVALAHDAGSGLTGYGFDAVIAGHSHSNSISTSGGVPVIQSGSSGTNIGRLKFVFDNINGTVQVTPTNTANNTLLLTNSTHLPVNVVDEDLKAKIDWYIQDSAALFDKVCGQADIALPNQSTVNNWATKLVFDFVERQTGIPYVVIQNSGGWRSMTGYFLKQGDDITYRWLNVLMPFDNEIVLMDLPGNQLINALNGKRANGSSDVTGYPVIAGAVKDGSNWRLSDGTLIEAGKTYKVSCNDFMFTGGDNYDMFESNSTGAFFLGDKLRDAMADEIGFRSTPAGPQEGDVEELTVFFTSDLHGAFTGKNYATQGNHQGLSRVATELKTRKSTLDTAGKKHLTIDVGDTIQGAGTSGFINNNSYTFPLMKGFNYLGFDAAVPGNHEFNFGAPAMLSAYNGVTGTNNGGFNGAKLCGNVYHFTGDGEPPDDAHIDGSDDLLPEFKAYEVFDLNGVRVAVIGMTSPGSDTWDAIKLQEAKLYTESAIGATKRAIQDIKNNNKADVIVLAAHMSTGDVFNRPGSGANSVLRDSYIAQNVDVFLGAHGHTRQTTTINGVKYGENSANGSSVGIVTIKATYKDGKWSVQNKSGSDVSINMQTLTTSVVEDANYLTHMAPEIEFAEEYTKVKIGELKNGNMVPLSPVKGNENLNPAYTQPTKLVSFINEIQMYYAEAEISGACPFNTSVQHLEGDITRGSLIGIYNYDSNTVYRLEMKGWQVKRWIEYVAQSQYTDPNTATDLSIRYNTSYRTDQFSGLNYTIDLTKPRVTAVPFGNRVTITSVTRLNGDVEPFDLNETYIVAANDYRTSSSILTTNFFTAAELAAPDAPKILQTDCNRGKAIAPDIISLMVDYISEVKGGVIDAADYEKNWEITPWWETTIENGAKLRARGELLTQKGIITGVSATNALKVSDVLNAQYPYGDLQDLIAEAEELVQASYTADTWAKLESALSAAKGITEEDSSADIRAAYDALKKAIGELEYFIDVTSVKIDGAAIQQVRIRNTKQFAATVNPTNATDKTLKWESSNEKIFTVDGNGLVKGVGTGSAKLIITASNGKTSFIMVQITA